MEDFLLFSGTSNVPLAEKVAALLHMSLGKVEITRFIDNECRVYVKDAVANKQVFVLQSLSEVADQHLVELCLLGQALKELHAAKVTAIIPWMGYSKQDKAFRPGEAISAQLVARFIEVAGFDAVVTCELHSKNILSYFHIPVGELSTQKLFHPKDGVVVSPDKGGISRSDAFATYHHLPIVYLTKMRNSSTGDVTVTEISDSVKEKRCIIYDDIINTGETAIKTSEFLKNQGATRVEFFATHAVLAGDAVQKLKTSRIDEIVITDTIHIQEHKLFSKLTVVSVAETIADGIMGE